MTAPLPLDDEGFNPAPIDDEAMEAMSATLAHWRANPRSEIEQDRIDEIFQLFECIAGREAQGCEIDELMREVETPA